MKLPDSPEDRRVRNEALAHVARKSAVAVVLMLVVGVFAHALGVPWFVVAIALAFIGYLVLFET